MSDVLEVIKTLKKIRITRDKTLQDKILIINKDAFDTKELKDGYKLIMIITNIKVSTLYECDKWVREKGGKIELFDYDYFIVNHTDFLYTPKSNIIVEVDEFKKKMGIENPLSDLMILSCHDSLARFLYYNPGDVIKYQDNNTFYFRTVASVNPFIDTSKFCYYFE